MSEWISVKDRLPEMAPIYPDGPKRSAHVIVHTTLGWVCEGWMEESYKLRKVSWKIHLGTYDVTDWQPLPKPPA